MSVWVYSCLVASSPEGDARRVEEFKKNELAPWMWEAGVLVAVAHFFERHFQLEQGMSVERRIPGVPLTASELETLSAVVPPMISKFAVTPTKEMLTFRHMQKKQYIRLREPVAIAHPSERPRSTRAARQLPPIPVGEDCTIIYDNSEQPTPLMRDALRNYAFQTQQERERVLFFLSTKINQNQTWLEQNRSQSDQRLQEISYIEKAEAQRTAEQQRVSEALRKAELERQIELERLADSQRRAEQERARLEIEEQGRLEAERIAAEKLQYQIQAQEADKLRIVEAEKIAREEEQRRAQAERIRESETRRMEAERIAQEEQIRRFEAERATQGERAAFQAEQAKIVQEELRMVPPTVISFRDETQVDPVLLPEIADQPSSSSDAIEAHQLQLSASMPSPTASPMSPASPTTFGGRPPFYSDTRDVDATVLRYTSAAAASLRQQPLSPVYRVASSLPLSQRPNSARCTGQPKTRATAVSPISPASLTPDFSTALLQAGLSGEAACCYADGGGASSLPLGSPSGASERLTVAPSSPPGSSGLVATLACTSTRLPPLPEETVESPPAGEAPLGGEPQSPQRALVIRPASPKRFFFPPDSDIEDYLRSLPPNKRESAISDPQVRAWIEVASSGVVASVLADTPSDLILPPPASAALSGLPVTTTTSMLKAPSFDAMSAASSSLNMALATTAAGAESADLASTISESLCAEMAGAGLGYPESSFEDQATQAGTSKQIRHLETNTDGTEIRGWTTTESLIVV